MDFNLDGEQELLRDTATRFVSERCNFETRRRQIAADDGESAPHWREFAELGWLALGVPEDAGGLGLSMVEAAIVCEALGHGLVIDPFVTSAVICPRILTLAAAFAPREDWLAQLAGGATRLALADGGHGGLDGCRFVRQPGGIVIDGVKPLVLGGHDAGAFILALQERASDPSTCSLWLLPAESAGVRTACYALLDGSRAADLHLSAVELPASACIAEGELASQFLEDALDRGRVAALADAVGSQQACITLAVEHIQNRQQFGQPIGRFQALQHMVSDMLVEHQSARSMLYRALAHLDASPPSRSAAVSAAKLVAGAAGCAIGKSAIQLHGACGFTDEYAVSHHYRRQVVFERTLGDATFHERRLIALRVPEWDRASMG